MSETFLQFQRLSMSESGKTEVHQVFSKDGAHWLGNVSWHGAWRKYTFWPNDGTLYDAVCLREIADFTERRTVEHRRKAKQGA